MTGSGRLRGSNSQAPGQGPNRDYPDARFQQDLRACVGGSARRQHIINQQNTLGSHRFVSSNTKGIGDVLGTFTAIQHSLRGRGCNPFQHFPVKGQIQSTRHFFRQKRRLIISAFPLTHGMQRDRQYTVPVLPHVIIGQHFQKQSFKQGFQPQTSLVFESVQQIQHQGVGNHTGFCGFKEKSNSMTVGTFEARRDLSIKGQPTASTKRGLDTTQRSDAPFTHITLSGRSSRIHANLTYIGKNQSQRRFDPCPACVS